MADKISKAAFWIALVFASVATGFLATFDVVLVRLGGRTRDLLVLVAGEIRGDQ